MKIKRSQLEECVRNWSALGDVPVDDDGIIDVPFLHFDAGEDREEIWHWFEEKYNVPVAWLMYHAKELEPEIVEDEV